jgi:uroporphyrinogen III methyltransferase/synthase
MKTMPETGIVYIIGAGPGDPGLITVRGKELLESCDAVVFDDLIPDELIAVLPASVEKYYVGKKPGHHFTSQDEINALIVKLARAGKSVARLKGGDPFIFGRGREEAEVLLENEIQYEIVPGVTSGIAAPMYAGIPCTDRNKASFVVFVTGHKAEDKATNSVPWEWIAGAHNGTVVIYMGIGELESIIENLINSGMPPSIPAAIIERGTFPSQRIIKAHLKDLPLKASSENIEPPAIVVIGDVVEYYPKLSWFNDRPLAELRVMVTRPADQAVEMYRVLRGYGAEVMAYPTIATEEYIDPSTWDSFQDIVSRSKKSDLSGWIILTSENGVRYFFNQFRQRGNDIRSLSNFKIAVVGYGTAAALKKHGINRDFVPTTATTAALADQLVSSVDLKGIPILRIRGNLGDDSIERKLRDAGGIVSALQVYRTFTPVWPDGFKEKLFKRPPDIITFTSGSTISGLFDLLGEADAKRLLEKSKTITIGPSTTNVLASFGLKPSLEAKEHSVPGLIDELVNYFISEREMK